MTKVKGELDKRTEKLFDKLKVENPHLLQEYSMIVAEYQTIIQMQDEQIFNLDARLNISYDLRDYIAAEALCGMLSHSTRYRPRDGRSDWHSAIAEEAYELADAMLKVKMKR